MDSEESIQRCCGSNCHPIACLLMIQKLVSGITRKELYEDLLRNELLTEEVKKCKEESQGTKDQFFS